MTKRRVEYPNYEALKAKHREGTDYRVILTERQSPVTIVAPHGGKIEIATSQIAGAIAAETYSLYCFEGLIDGSGILHIASTNFDEPRCVDLVQQSDVVVTVHGLKEPSREYVHIGGRNTGLRQALNDRLIDAGFDAGAVTTGSHAARDERNICNLARRPGCQLEITLPLRRRLTRLEERPRLVQFTEAVRRAIEQDGEAL